MEIDDLIMSLITLVLIMFFMFTPLFRKLLKAFQKEEEEAERGEDRIYESTDSRRVLMNLTETSEAPEGKKIVFGAMKMPESSPTGKRAAQEYRTSSPSPEKRDLRKAVLWKEILGAPRALKSYGEDEFF